METQIIPIFLLVTDLECQARGRFEAWGVEL